MKQERFPFRLMALMLLMDIAVFSLQKVASNHAARMDENYLLAIISHGWAWGAFVLAPLQLWTWTRILAKADISVAYPMTSLSVPLTMLASFVLFAERPAWPVWVGALLISFGAATLHSKGEAPPIVELSESETSPPGTPRPRST